MCTYITWGIPTDQWAPWSTGPALARNCQTLHHKVLDCSVYTQETTLRVQQRLTNEDAQIRVSGTAGFAVLSLTYAVSCVADTGRNIQQDTVILLYLPVERGHETTLRNHDAFPRRHFQSGVWQQVQLVFGRAKCHRMHDHCDSQ